LESQQLEGVVVDRVLQPMVDLVEGLGITHLVHLGLVFQVKGMMEKIQALESLMVEVEVVLENLVVLLLHHMVVLVDYSVCMDNIYGTLVVVVVDY
jgi:hypothetical protein